MKTIRNKMKHNAKAYNKNLTDEQLDSYPIRRLLSLTHPLDRPDFIRELRKEVENAS